MSCGCGGKTVSVDLPCASGVSGAVGGCGHCGDDCGCSPATPTPAYNQAPGCEESHTRLLIQNQYAAALAVGESFNMPACNAVAVVVIPGLQSIAVGSYLWNPVYGYLKVTAFDYASSTVNLTNTCVDGNAVAGTTIPNCTLFTVTDDPTDVENPCDSNSTTAGTLLVCNGDGTFPLAPTGTGQVPVSTGNGNEVEFQTIDLGYSNCTTLLSDLTLVPANAGPYVINVASTAFFNSTGWNGVSGRIIQIGGRADRFTVASIVGPTQLTATINPTVAGVVVIPAGTPVCLAPCCEQLYELFSLPCNWDLSTRVLQSVGFAFTQIPDQASITVGTQLQSPTADLIVVNTTCKDMVAEVIVDFEATYSIQGSAADWYSTALIAKVGTAAGAIGATVPAIVAGVHSTYHSDGYVRPDPTHRETINWKYIYTHVIPANSEYRVDAATAIQYGVGSVTNMLIQTMTTSVTSRALAI